MVVAGALIVEVEDRVGECVRDAAVVQRFIGIGDIDVVLEQPRHEMLGDVGPPAQAVMFGCVLAPDVRLALHHRRGLRLPPRVEVEVVECENRKRRDHVFFEVLVLVVALDHDDIGLEFVERRAHAREPGDELLSVFGRGACAEVVRPFGPHGRGPVRDVLFRCGDRGVLQGPTQDAGHVRIR